MKKVILLCWLLAAFVLSSTSWASVVTLYDATHTGSALDQLVTNGVASYPDETPTVSDTSLVFSSGTYRGVIYRLPIVSEGEMTDLTNLVVEISLDWNMLSDDNDLSFGISDQSQTLGVSIGDTNEYWAVNGEDNGSTFSSSWIPSGSFNASIPITLTIEVGSESSTLTIVNNDDESASFNIDRDFDVTNQIDFFLGRDNEYESYKINSVTITAQAQTAPVPLPGAVWLFGAGIAGLIGLNRKKKF